MLGNLTEYRSRSTCIITSHRYWPANSSFFPSFDQDRSALHSQRGDLAMLGTDDSAIKSLLQPSAQPRPTGRKQNYCAAAKRLARFCPARPALEKEVAARQPVVQQSLSRYSAVPDSHRAVTLSTVCFFFIYSLFPSLPPSLWQGRREERAAKRPSCQCPRRRVREVVIQRGQRNELEEETQSSDHGSNSVCS